MSTLSYALPDPTILIIDDHDLVATSLALSLRSAGLRAQRHAVRSREDALVATATLPPGVALLDLDLGREADGTLIDGTPADRKVLYGRVASPGPLRDLRRGPHRQGTCGRGVGRHPEVGGTPRPRHRRPAGHAGRRGDAPGAAQALHRGTPASAGSGSSHGSAPGPTHRARARRTQPPCSGPASAGDRRGVLGLPRDGADPDPCGPREARGRLAACRRFPSARLPANPPAGKLLTTMSDNVVRGKEGSCGNDNEIVNDAITRGALRLPPD